MIASRTKKILIGLGVVAVAIAGAAFFGNRQATPTPTGSLTSSANTNRVDGPIGTSTTSSAGADEFFNTLLSIKNIRIDTSLFKNPAYLYLKDHPVILGTDTVGRPNPFAPIGTDIVPDTSISAGSQSVNISPTPANTTATAAAQPSTGIQTLQPGKITRTSAELGAAVAFPDGTGPAVVVFQYGTDANNITTPTESIILQNGGTLTLPLTGLKPNTAYFVQATLLYGTQTLAGSTMTFTTKK